VSDSAESETRSRQPRGGAREPNQEQRATLPGDGPETGKSTRLRGLPARAKAAAREARTRAVAPLVEEKQDIYGVLGVAAALLFSLYLAGRLIVATAVLDATLWERRRAAGSAPAEEGGQQ
jgi:hypothetical protein